MEQKQLRLQRMRKPGGRRYRFDRKIGTVRWYKDVLEHIGPSATADRGIHRLNMVIGLVQHAMNEIARADACCGQGHPGHYRVKFGTLFVDTGSHDRWKTVIPHCGPAAAGLQACFNRLE